MKIEIGITWIFNKISLVNDMLKSSLKYDRQFFYQLRLYSYLYNNCIEIKYNVYINKHTFFLYLMFIMVL